MLCFLLHGNIACGILQDSLVVRVGPDKSEASLAIPGIREFDVTDRPMQVWVVVPLKALQMKISAWWVIQGVSFARTLPPK